MKQLIYGAFVSLITGICFTIGVFLVIFAAEAWKGEPKSEIKGEWVDNPAGVSIAEHKRIEGTPSFTVQGIIRNDSNRVWVEVEVEAKILAGQSQINECDTTVRGKFAPGERRAFQIECYGVAGSGTPDNINYRVEVVNGKAEI